MISDWLDKARGFKDELPNEFSITLGELIRKARLDVNMSQAELAEKAYFRQAAISQIETGKRDVSASEIIYLSFALNKPINYFFQFPILQLKPGDDSLSLPEQELLLEARRLLPDDLKKLIAQVKALADLSSH